MVDLAQTRTVLFDMDGVLYRGNAMLPGTQELLAFLDRTDVRYACITNNASLTPAEYEAKLAKMGIRMPAELVLTSALVTGHYLRRTYPRGTRVLIVGMGGLREALLADGSFVEDEATPELVVQGADFKLTYDRLKLATLAIRRGARYIATNPDRTFPAEEGLIPGAGAVMAALVAATDTEPLIIGKPAPTMFQAAVDMLGGDPATTLVIGDRLDTDIGGAINAGLPSLLVLTGVSTRAEAENGPIRPDLIYADLPTLLADWQAAR